MKKLGINDTLETDRCILKIPQESETEYMWNLITDNITKHMIWDKWEDYSSALKNIQETQLNAKEWKTWDAAIYDKKTGKCIGRCWINKIDELVPAFELWYWIAEQYWGQWIMPECVNRYLKFAFEESWVEKVAIRCSSRNINSEKVALKCGFTFEWEFKNHERIDGELRGTKFFWITKMQYFNK